MAIALPQQARQLDVEALTSGPAQAEARIGVADAKWWKGQGQASLDPY
ncbi:MAG: hypothetical protein KDA91_10585 [Planctomycetaceae bacterium]|nr:hypothetical protein [Planctomycetaceae bacterium]